MAHINVNEKDFFIDTCPECGGTGISYADKKNKFCSMTCPTCNGTGHGNISKGKVLRALATIAILLVIGYLISRLFN